MLVAFEEKKIKGTPFDFLFYEKSSKIVVENSPPPWIRAISDFRGGAVPVDFYCILINDLGVLGFVRESV